MTTAIERRWTRPSGPAPAAASAPHVERFAGHRSAGDDVTRQREDGGDERVLEPRGDDVVGPRPTGCRALLGNAADVSVLRHGAHDGRVGDGREVVAEDGAGEDGAEQEDRIGPEQDACGEDEARAGDGGAVASADARRQQGGEEEGQGRKERRADAGRAGRPHQAVDEVAGLDGVGEHAGPEPGDHRGGGHALGHPVEDGVRVALPVPLHEQHADDEADEHADDEARRVTDAEEATLHVAQTMKAASGRALMPRPP